MHRLENLVALQRRRDLAAHLQNRVEPIHQVQGGRMRAGRARLGGGHRLRRFGLQTAEQFLTRGQVLIGVRPSVFHARAGRASSASVPTRIARPDVD